MVKRQQPFSQRLIICHRHWHYTISASINRSHLCYKSIINYDLDITNTLVVSPQIRYIEVFDITNPSFNEQIWPVPSDFVKSRFHCTRILASKEIVLRNQCTLFYLHLKIVILATACKIPRSEWLKTFDKSFERALCTYHSNRQAVYRLISKRARGIIVKYIYGTRPVI